MNGRFGKYFPTNKWWAATITGAGTIVGMLWVGDGINTDDEKLLVVGIVTQRLVAYVVPNKNGTSS